MTEVDCIQMKTKTQINVQKTRNMEFTKKLKNLRNIKWQMKGIMRDNTKETTFYKIYSKVRMSPENREYQKAILNSP
jgi:hypothetical protein